MCGIVGVLVFENSSYIITEPYLNNIRDTITHRGPDGVGSWISENGKIGLGHCRLSIIDLSESASQPMCNEDNNIWIVYNGEIYNHYQIRPELEKAGHRFKTDHSDTEVIIHAYEEWGIDCIHRFRGMFSFGLWDGRERCLWLVRDRIGIKPLYYSIINGRIIFASEIKAILADSSITRVVDDEAFYHYLSFLTTPPPQTLFQGIKKLPGGSFLRIGEDGQCREQCYWDVWDHTQPLTGRRDEEIAEMVLAELKESVRLRKVSDVPVGVFLSGGIDSSTNAVLFAEGENQPVKTFSVGYRGTYSSLKDETPFARQMAGRIGSQHYEVFLDASDLVEFVPAMVRYQDEPIADPVCVPVYYVSKLAREKKMKVCQLGEGSDELFWGYPKWRTMLSLQGLSDRFPFPFLKKMAVSLLSLFPGICNKTRLEWLRRAALQMPIFWGGAEAFTHLHKEKLLSTRLRKNFKGYCSFEALKKYRGIFENNAHETAHLNWFSYLDLKFRLPELLLMRVDKMSMAVSLECRVPFLDHKLVQLAMSIPTAVKTRNQTLKYVLKKSVENFLPPEIVHREKMGFDVPLREWCSGELGQWLRKELTDFCSQTDFFDTKELRRLLYPVLSPKAWYIFNFALWWKEYIGPS